jgi:hypothetical protein
LGHLDSLNARRHGVQRAYRGGTGERLAEERGRWQEQ